MKDSLFSQGLGQFVDKYAFHFKCNWSHFLTRESLVCGVDFSGRPIVTPLLGRLCSITRQLGILRASRTHFDSRNYSAWLPTTTVFYWEDGIQINFHFGVCQMKMKLTFGRDAADEIDHRHPEQKAVRLAETHPPVVCRGKTTCFQSD